MKCNKCKSEIKEVEVMPCTVCNELASDKAWNHGYVECKEAPSLDTKVFYCNKCDKYFVECIYKNKEE